MHFVFSGCLFGALALYSLGYIYICNFRLSFGVFAQFWADFVFPGCFFLKCICTFGVYVCIVRLSCVSVVQFWVLCLYFLVVCLVYLRAKMIGKCC